MATDRELAQALLAKKKQNSAFDTIGAVNNYYNQTKTQSLALPLDFGKSIPPQQRKDAIESFNPTTRSAPNPTYYDPTANQVVPVNPNHKGFWQGVSDTMTKAYNLTSHIGAFATTMTQTNLTTLPGKDRISMKERWNKTQDVSVGQAVFSAAAQIPGAITSLTAPDVMNKHFLAGAKGFDILDPAQRKEAFTDQAYGRIGSWTTDFIARWTIDPTVIAGK